jgi:hypothetical protein
VRTDRELAPALHITTGREQRKMHTLDGSEADICYKASDDRYLNLDGHEISLGVLDAETRPNREYQYAT